MDSRTTIAPEEQNWAVIAHLSGLAYLVVPLGGIIFPIVLIFAKNDSPTVSTIARQALYLNIFTVLATGAMMVVCFLLAVTFIGIPLAIILGIVVGALLAVGPIALPIVGAVKAASGEYYRYPIVGQEPLYLEERGACPGQRDTCVGESGADIRS